MLYRKNGRKFEVDLPPRIESLLKARRIRTINALRLMSRSQLDKVTGLGIGSVATIKQILEQERITHRIR
jgi:DNA-directed RNA polymerase alpha subunit